MAFELPPLPYDFDALEPHIDEQTMRIHHGKHHAGYTAKLNAALEGTEWADQPVTETLAKLDSLPVDKQTAVRNNGGGFLNHGIFWTIMSPNGGGAPTGELATAITDAFGSFDAFKEQFETVAKTQFGSGWAWLGYSAENGLHLHGMPNQDSPALHGHVGILGLDVWEHAYYLKYQNRRPDYVSAFWNVVNWDECDRRYREAKAQLG
ncbi:superoxide dismutase [Rubrivirga sp. IMCC45206]|uniref:superoxide dismutase n=1 Tax=Rubrivirga sp. IMCC45206 TaxID=3391614 RepID=UPI0039903181